MHLWIRGKPGFAQARAHLGKISITRGSAPLKCIIIRDPKQRFPLAHNHFLSAPIPPQTYTQPHRVVQTSNQPPVKVPILGPPLIVFPFKYQFLQESQVVVWDFGLHICAVWVSGEGYVKSKKASINVLNKSMAFGVNVGIVQSLLVISPNGWNDEVGWPWAGIPKEIDRSFWLHGCIFLVFGEGFVLPKTVISTWDTPQQIQNRLAQIAKSLWKIFFRVRLNCGQFCLMNNKYSTLCTHQTQTCCLKIQITTWEPPNSAIREETMWGRPWMVYPRGSTVILDNGLGLY